MQDRVVVRPPTRVRAAGLLEGVPGLAAQFSSQVLPRRVSWDAAGTATVRCSCGAHVTLIKRPWTDCLCGRYFLQGSNRVYVAGPYAAEPS